MEEINLNELFSYFWSKKLIILLITLITLLIGFIYSAYIQKPMYQSYTTILLTKEENTAITSTDLNLNKSLVDTYREIIKSNTVINKVISNLGLDYTTNELKKKVTVESVNDTEIIKITVKDEDASLASKIANETARVFNVEIIKLYNIQNIGIVDTAEINNNPYNINVLKQLVISALIGLVLSFALVFVIFYFDTSVKSADEIEKKLNIPVIGYIPQTGGKK